MKQSPGHSTVMPYLIVEGAVKLHKFLETVFQAEVADVMWRDDDKTIVRHSEVRIGDTTVMIADATDQFPSNAPGMLYIYCEDTDATFETALTSGAESYVEPHEAEYPARSAGVLGPDGNVWWMATLH